MRNLRRTYYRLFLAFMLILCLFCIFLTMATVRYTQDVNAQETRDQIYEIKKTFLKDTIHNATRDLDELRGHFYDLADLRIARIKKRLTARAEQMESGFIESAIKLLTEDEFSRSLDVVVFDTAHNRPVFSNTNFTDAGMEEFTTDLLFPGTAVYMRVNKAFTDKQAKDAFAVLIHKKIFENDAYIWVNEVINFAGGAGTPSDVFIPICLRRKGCIYRRKLGMSKGINPI